VQLSLRKVAPVAFVAIAVAGWYSDQVAWLAALVPIAGHAMFAVIFGASLRPGREPLITTFSRLARGHLPDEVVPYTRRLTIVWTVVMSVLTVALSVVALVRPGLLGGAVTTSIGLIVALFLGEHWVRHRVFPHLPLTPPLRTGRIVLQALRERR
jgi:uncharacterized membrane protein